MKRKIIGLIMITAFLVLAVESVAAAPAFLCPVVGDGVLNADAKNGDNGVTAITPPVGTSFFPGLPNGKGGNMAGANANPHAYNTKGPGDPTAGPGQNPDFSPIWPPS